jgi:hypothetical protein
LGIIGGVTAAGGIASAAIGANAAGNAADTQAAAANHAADIQQQASKDALDFQKQQYATSQAQQAPWLAAGQTALGQLSAGTAPGGSLVTPYSGSFTAPTDITEQNDPGFQARLKLGTDAIQKSAAARGSVLTGGTAKALDQFGQDYASNEYGNVYNRALTDYSTKYNAYNNDQTNQFNRLAALSGSGQTTATNLANQGQNASNNVTGNLLNTAQNVGQQYNNAAAATASGYVGGANAWSNGLGGITNNLTNLALIGKLGSGSGYGGGSNFGTLGVG